MNALVSLKEFRDYQEELFQHHRYYLWHKGYRKTINGAITQQEVEETKTKYGFSSAIQDLDFGILEGKVFFTILLETFYNADFDTDYDGGHVGWIKDHISKRTGRIRLFILTCVKNEPQIGNMPVYDYHGQLDSCLANANHEGYADEVSDWYLTPYEFGQLCGFVMAASWAIGNEWVFNEDKFDVPINLKRFYDFLSIRAAKLRRRNIQEVSITSQIILNIKCPKAKSYCDEDGGYIVRSFRHKSPQTLISESSDPPKPSSWLDW